MKLFCLPPQMKNGTKRKASWYLSQEFCFGRIQVFSATEKQIHHPLKINMTVTIATGQIFAYLKLF